MTKLDEKLARIRAGKYKRSDFIIADAKDGDMGAGVLGAAPKRRADGTRLRGKTRVEFLDDIEAVVKQGIVDVMLVSASNLELLHERGVFKKSKVKPVIRANDTTDCWGLIRNGTYHKQPSRPFRTASLPRVMYNATGPVKGARKIYGTDLGLYSITMMNDVDADSAHTRGLRRLPRRSGSPSASSISSKCSTRMSRQPWIASRWVSSSMIASCAASPAS